MKPEFDAAEQMQSMAEDLRYLRPAYDRMLHVLGNLYQAYNPPGNKPTSIDKILDIIDSDVAEIVLTEHPDWAPDE